MTRHRNSITEELVASFEAIIQRAFLKGIADIRSQSQVDTMIRLLRAGDIEGALRAAQIDPLAFDELRDAIEKAFVEGGILTASSLPAVFDDRGVRLVFRFNARNPRAESILRNLSSTKIVQITDDIRSAVRDALAEGMRLGNNPTKVALDIVGRINPSTGVREGGLVGLTSAQARAVENAKLELTSGDPSKLKAYLKRVRRDKRFDRSVLKAIRENKPVPKNLVEKAIARYKDRLLKLRGDTIGRTEALSSLHRAQMEAVRQAIESGLINERDIRKVWISARDEKVRPSHQNVDDGSSVAFNERFGNGLLHPGDPNGPAEEVINCRCTMGIRIDFLANIQ